MYKNIKTILFLFIGIAVIIVFVISYVSKFDIKYELVSSYDAKVSKNNGLYWFSLRSDEYQPFFNIENLKSYDINIKESDLDFDNYTYIVTLGHELKSLKYSFSETKSRKCIIIPKQFIGIVDLDNKFEKKVFVYKIRKMDIDCDYHDSLLNVSFS